MKLSQTLFRSNFHGGVKAAFLIGEYMALKIELNRGYLAVGVEIDGNTIGTVSISKSSEIKKIKLDFEFNDEFIINRIYSENQLLKREIELLKKK